MHRASAAALALAVAGNVAFALPTTAADATPIRAPLRRVSRGAGASRFARRAAAPHTSITNEVSAYAMTVGFGTPATNYDLLVDTGSGNTWAADFKITSDAVNTGDKWSVTYGSGTNSGTEYRDTITLTSGIVLKNQSVGRSASDLGSIAGIIGFSPVAFTNGTVENTVQVPTVMDTAYAQGLISANVLGVSLAPLTGSSDEQANGELTFGGVDTTKYTGDIMYQPVITTGNVSRWWSFDLSSSLTSTAGTTIVDTGTTVVFVPPKWFDAYKAAIPNSQVDEESGFLRFPKASLSSVPNITFTIGGQPLVYVSYAQLVEQNLYDDFGLTKGYYYSWLSPFTDTSVEFPFEAVLGMKFLERFYSVFDTDNSRVGFGATANSYPTSPP